MDWVGFAQAKCRFKKLWSVVLVLPGWGEGKKWGGVPAGSKGLGRLIPESWLAGLGVLLVVYA